MTLGVVVLWRGGAVDFIKMQCCGVLQSVAVCCDVLRCAAMCVATFVAVCCSVFGFGQPIAASGGANFIELQSFAVYYSVLQCVVCCRV